MRNGKFKAENITKASENVLAMKCNERVFWGILSIKDPNNGKKVTLKKKNWRFIVNKFSGMEFSNLYDTNNFMIKPTCERFKKWKQNGHPVNFVRCDNAGENTKLEKTANSKAWKLVLKL